MMINAMAATHAQTAKARRIRFTPRMNISSISFRLRLAVSISRRPIVRPQFATGDAQLLFIKNSTAGAYLPPPDVLLVEGAVRNFAHLGCGLDGQPTPIKCIF